MKKFFTLILFFFLVLVNTVFSQTAESPVPQMDEAVKTLARDIHAKLIEKRAERITIGQFVYNNSGTTPLSSYWSNQLIGELANMSGRNYSVISGGTNDAEWTISGEIVLAADIIRVYSRLIQSSNRAIEGSFQSSFQRDEHINSMIVSVNSGGPSFSAASDTFETDSWENPVSYTIGSSQSVPVMNRTITSGDEDFFLLVPERDGRLTAETTGSIDTYMYLYNYDNEEELSSNDDGGQGSNARISYNVRAGTRYLAMVRGYSSSTSGSYGFRAYIIVREGASSWENPDSYEIGIGEDNVSVVQKTLNAGDEEYFLLVPNRDGRLTIETTGRTDTYIELFDADSRDLLEENDDGGQNSNARLRYNVTAGKRYIAMVRGYSSNISGSYGFRAFFPGTGMLPGDQYEPDDDPSQAKVIEIGASQQRTFHSENDIDWVQFQINRAGRYVIHARGVNSNRLDTYIELFDGSMNSIAEDDDGGDSMSSRLSINLNNGTYFLKVWCIDEEPNQAYTLSVEAQ